MLFSTGCAHLCDVQKQNSFSVVDLLKHFSSPACQVRGAAEINFWALFQTWQADSTWMYSCRSVRLQQGQRRNAVIRDISGVGHRGVTNLTASIWFERDIVRFFATWCNYRFWFCVRRALWGWFYPRLRKRNHLERFATGVPTLKTLLDTPRVNRLKREELAWVRYK